MKKIHLATFCFILVNLAASGQNFFEKANSQIFDFAISGSANELIFPYDNIFKCIDLSDNSISRNFSTEVEAAVTRMQINSNDSLLVAGFQNGSLNIYDLNTDALISSFQDLNGNITALAISNNNFLVAAASDGGELIIYDLRINQVLNKFLETGFISDLEFSNDSRFLVSGGQFGLKMMNPNTGSILDEITLPGKKWIRGIKINSEKKQIYFAGDNGKIMLTTINSKDELSQASIVYKENIWLSDLDIIFDKNDLFLFSGFDGTIRINGAFTEYTHKIKALIYRNKFLPMDESRQIKIAFTAKDKGLYIYSAENMNL